MPGSTEILISLFLYALLMTILSLRRIIKTRTEENRINRALRYWFEQGCR